MADDFDPYYKWLGIRPEHQPPHFYRLLAIELFESDQDVIANAADQRMVIVKTYQTGQHAALSQQLLNEIATARSTLLNPQKKLLYDAQLQHTPTVTVVPARPVAAPPPPPPPTPAVAVAAKPQFVPDAAPTIQGRRSYGTRKRAQRSQAGFWLAAFALIFLLGCVVVYAAWQSRGQPSGVETDVGFTDDRQDSESQASEPKQDVSDGNASRGGTTDANPASHKITTRNDGKSFEAAPPVNRRHRPPRDSVERPKDNRDPTEDRLFGPNPTQPADATRLGVAQDTTSESDFELPDPVADFDIAGDLNQRWAVPDESKLKDLLRQLDNLYKTADGESADGQRAAARKILAASTDTKDTAERYAMLEKTRLLAMSAGDARMALEAAVQLARLFDVDRLDLAVDVIRSTRVATSDAKANATLASEGVRVIEEMFIQDRYDLANEVVDKISIAAQRSSSPRLIEQAEQYAKEVRVARRAFVKVQDAIAALKKNPTDPEANLLLGRYYCFIKRDWNRGMPLLGKGSNPVLRELSQLELQSDSSKQTQLRVADGWFDLIENQEVLTPPLVTHQQTSLRLRARQLYQGVAPWTKGIERARVDQRLALLEEAIGNR